MHNYKKLYSELLAKEFLPAEAHRIVHIIRIEECVTEQLYSEEIKDEKRKREEIQRFWKLLAKLTDWDRFNQLYALHVVAPQMTIEREQRQRLLETLNRSPSVFLSNVLRAFYQYPNERIELIAGVLTPQLSPVPSDFLDGLLV